MRLVKDANNHARLTAFGVTCARETQLAMDLADRHHWEVCGREAEITSIVDGDHSEHSRHYVGLAFDIRIWYMPNPADFAKWLREHLGTNYDVVLEDTHIHVEFDPDRR
jgi:hypothetical protein